MKEREMVSKSIPCNLTFHSPPHLNLIVADVQVLQIIIALQQPGQRIRVIVRQRITGQPQFLQHRILSQSRAQRRYRSSH